LRAGRAAGLPAGLPLLPLAPREDLAGRELRAPEGAGAACRPGPRLGRRDARRAARAAEGVRAAAGARARRRGRALQPGRAPAERGVGAGRLGTDAPRRLLAAPAADGLAVAAARRRIVPRACCGRGGQAAGGVRAAGAAVRALPAAPPRPPRLGPRRRSARDRRRRRAWARPLG